MAGEKMPYYKPGDDITGKATANVTGGRLVMVDTAQLTTNAWAPEGLKSTATPNVVPIKHCTAGAKALGWAVRDIASGAPGPVMMQGVVPCTSGAAVNPGVEVESDANGKVITLASGKAVGLAMSQATATDQTIAVKLY